MAQYHGVGPCMGDDDHSFGRILHGPEVSMIGTHWFDPVAGEGLLQSSDNAFVETAERFPAW